MHALQIKKGPRGFYYFGIFAIHKIPLHAQLEPANNNFAKKLNQLLNFVRRVDWNCFLAKKLCVFPFWQQVVVIRDNRSSRNPLLLQWEIRVRGSARYHNYHLKPSPLVAELNARNGKHYS